MSDELIPLSIEESAYLAEAEATIRSGLRTFVDVGRALGRIRDGRLYRQTHTTFEAYCEMEFGLSRKRAYDLMGASETIEAMSPIGDTPLPVTESQARELSGLDAETAAQVMRRAAEAPKVTAAAIAEAREEIAPKAPSRFTKVRSEYLVDKETGEVIDADNPPAGFMTENPAKIAADTMRDARNEPWSVFTTKLLADLKRWQEWSRLPGVGGADGVVESLRSWPLPDTDDDLARAVDSLDRAIGWLTEFRVTFAAARSPRLRSVQ